jgi:type VI secretion system protein VasJ
MGYRLIRSARWDVLEKAPPSDGGKTQLPAPNAQQRTYFQKLVADKEWKTIIEKAEAAFVSGANHLWLDLQRCIATACVELGADYTQIKNAVLLETAMLLKRIPDLVSLNFSDGSPFCDDATKDWINSEVQSALGSGGGGQMAGGIAGDTLAEEQREVNQLVSAGKLEEALALVQGNMRSSSSERDNFRRTVVVGTLLLKAKQPDIAMSALESLNEKIERHGLDKWDPDIAVEAWAALVTSYKVAKVQKPQNIQAVIMEKQNTILSKISQLDPKKAFTLSK